MTVRAIYNIKMNRLILAPAAVVWSLSRLMQMNQISVCLEAILRQNTECLLLQKQRTDLIQAFCYILVVIHLVDFSLQA